jgi:hypothetical protein
MHGEKKICIRLTLRRIVGALMLASIAANLVIVGAVFGADSARMTPTVTALLTTLDRFTYCFHAYRYRHLQAHRFLIPDINPDAQQIPLINLREKTGIVTRFPA